MLNQTLAFEALVDWNFWGNFRENLRPREVIPRLPTRGILIIKGIRRSGKSRLSYLIAKKFPQEKCLLINFEDPRLKDADSKDIMKLVELYQRNVSEELPSLLIMDEVQNVKDWERVARLYAEVKKINVIVTGSSSKLMSEEYASILTGRHIDFEVFPLSFREFLMWSDTKFGTELERSKNRIRIFRNLNLFMEMGGFPGVFLAEEKKERIELLRGYFYDIIMKDIVARYSVRETEKIERLAKIYVSNIATLQPFNRLKNTVNLSLDSVERFSKYFETARLLFFIPKFGYSVAQQILSVKKVYCVDQGFFSTLGFKFSTNIGRLMENVVAIELLRRKSYWHPQQDIFYFKDYQQREVDFVVKEGHEIKQLIQVTYASGRDEIDKRELRSLLKASEVLKCKDLLVVTWDYEDEERLDEKVVKFVPLWKWIISIE